MKAMKHFLYARKSSEDEERQVMSIEAQLTELDEYAKREKLVVAERFIESKSAKAPGRVEFNRMLERIYNSGEPVGILAWHPDRLARNSVDGGQVIYLIDIQKIAALRFPTFWFEPSPQGLFMLQVAFGQSKYYSDNLSENVKRGMRQKLRRGEWLNIAPVGYVNNPKTRNIEPDPVKAKIILAIFEEFAAGKHSLESARHRLGFLGLVSRSGTTLGKSAVQRILTNPVYLGLIVSNGETFQGSFEPLIGNELFDAVQEQLSLRAKPRKSRHKHGFPFTGLLTCGECGGAITAQYARGNGGTYVYYRCSKKNGKCGQPYVRDVVLVEQVRELLQKASLPERWAQAAFDQVDRWEEEGQGQRRSFSRKKAQDMEAVQAKLDRLVNGYLEGLIDKDTYQRKKNELIRQKIGIETRQAASGEGTSCWVEPMREFLETAHKAGKLAFSDDFPEMKNILEKIGTNRQVFHKKVEVEFVRPFDRLLGVRDLWAGEDGLEGSKTKGLPSEMEGSPVWSG